MASTSVLGLSITLTPTLLTALRIAPLVGSTASLTHAYLEWVFTSSFLWYPNTRTAFNQSVIKTAPPTKQQKSDYASRLDTAKDIVHPAVFSNFFNTALWSVIGFNSVTTFSALANLFLFGEGLEPSRTLYTVGLSAAVAHYIFVPLVAGPVAELVKMCVLQEQGEEIKEKGKAVRNQAEWTSLHTKRFLTVDVLAWVSFAVGVVRVLTK
ncbi:hypothetical protein B0J11DRAFT_127640 [Dendryphion nanum]|uniref:Integral membrane protein n=1 Tax=Dendryphion nanum TaxID=256645 RepID=A0A9P9IBE1_9PLEO|nr:hypothetical protein B0J11DRAFT_127640 [Dendryphion nanum]